MRVANSREFVRFIVTDNGIGIPAENLSRIFGHGFTTKKSGHGFGLSGGIKSVQELGGDIEVQSEGLGKGASFTLRTPNPAAEPRLGV